MKAKILDTLTIVLTLLGTLLIALALMGAGAFLYARQNPPPKIEIEIAVAARDIREGDRLKPEDIAFKAIDPKALISPLIRRGEHLYLGYVAMMDIPKGEPVLKGAMGLVTVTIPQLGPKVSPGMRAIAIPVDQVASAGHLIEPEDWVDVLVSMEAPKNEAGSGQREESLTLCLVENAKVLAVGKRMIMWKLDDYRTVTLECTPEEVAALTFALHAERASNPDKPDAPTPFTLSLRNPMAAARAVETQDEKAQVSRGDWLADQASLEGMLQRGRERRAELYRESSP